MKPQTKLRTLMPRPHKNTAKWLKRELNTVDRRILLLAGNGSLIRGYQEVLSFYAYFYLKGYRYWMPRDCLTVTFESDKSFSNLGKEFKRDKSYKCRDWFKTDEEASESPINA